MIVAVIPARGGSKRIPKKNIKEFFGKPIIAWSINAALNSKCFDKVVVSTDDDEIAQTAIDYGAEVPFVRPDYLSDDQTGTIAVLRHAINWFLQNGFTPNIVCCIYATAPFIRSSNLVKAYKEFVEKENICFLFSATSYEYPIQRAFKIDGDGYASMFNPGSFNMRSQDLEEAYHDAAQFYFGKTKIWLERNNIFEGSRPYILPSWQVQDIDTEEDWIRAELMFQNKKNNSQ